VTLVLTRARDVHGLFECLEEFLREDKLHANNDSPLFRWKTKNYISYLCMIKKFRMYLRISGCTHCVDEETCYKGHSFRRGGALNCYHGGWAATCLLLHFDWLSPNMLKRYTTTNFEAVRREIRERSENKKKASECRNSLKASLGVLIQFLPPLISTGRKGVPVHVAKHALQTLRASTQPSFDLPIFLSQSKLLRTNHPASTH